MTEQSIYQKPKLRISATFPATDGACPEQVEVEFSDTANVTGPLITEVIGALAQVPHVRYQTPAEPGTAMQKRGTHQ